MKNNNSYINSDNGNVSWNGELSIQKGDHSNISSFLFYILDNTTESFLAVYLFVF